MRFPCAAIWLMRVRRDETVENSAATYNALMKIIMLTTAKIESKVIRLNKLRKNTTIYHYSGKHHALILV
jgi:hypothetical protein